MKYLLLIALLFSSSLVMAEEMSVNEEEQMLEPVNDCECQAKKEVACECQHEKVLTPYHDIRISVKGQGVAPVNTASPAQAYALAKRAAIADSYRLIAEKVKGVRVEGIDTIKNMMVKRSTVRTYVDAMIRNASVVETNFNEGLCEVEMEIVLTYSQFSH